ncbi:MAG TPA: hypothetical protein VGX68_26005 [Thermoanaerobaculia bacterium]|jgi:hypothetical protein|nr:hypothetical protein [Thermoanaerobaculia bacterium]
MKRLEPVAVILVGLTAAVCAGGCSRAQHLGPAAFVRKVELEAMKAEEDRSAAESRRRQREVKEKEGR